MTQFALDFRNTNALWASVLVETLARAGVRRAVVSPGSRSTPLTIALAANPAIEAIPVLDERSAAFFALGLAKTDLRPVVLVCTSGTAAANYLPAVVEAYESAVPLVVITADRPPELRACASGQTIDQQKLYGGYVHFFHEYAVPELNESRLAYLRQSTLHAVTRSVLPQPGPVHLNAPFRDPLPPIADGGVAEKFGAAIDWTMFFSHLAPPLALQSLSEVPPLAADVHGLVVVGPAQPADPSGFAQSVGVIAQKLGWPVLADGLSPIRNHAEHVPNVVTTYDTILRNPTAAERLNPEVVLCIGGWPTSKVLRTWLEASDAAIWIVSERVDNRDALHGRTRQIFGQVAGLANALPAGTPSEGYQRMWARYEGRVRSELDQRLGAESGLFEPKAAWLLAQHLPPETPLMIANSMPIRDVEYVWPAGDRAIRPLCNRGANGIDGTLSTALGIAHGTQRPTVLLTGDLALLHDTNGFLIAERAGTSLTIIVINNRGGGIFEHLPVAPFDPPFEEFFATPQRADFEQLCSAYAVQYEAITEWDRLVALVSELPSQGVRLLEVRTDRKADAPQRKDWFNGIAASLT